MFFSVNLRSIEMTEQLQSNNFATECTKLLWQELLDFRFEGSYCGGDDDSLSYKNYKKTSFVMWKKFYSILLEGNMSIARKRIWGAVFQILSKIVCTNKKKKKKTFGVDIAYSMHKLSRSKYLIELFNCLDISVSYDELEKDNMDLVQHTLDRTVDHRVPVLQSTKFEIVIHSAVDN